MKRLPLIAAGLIIAFVMSGCAAADAFGQKITEAYKGVPATWTSYDQSGRVIDEIKGTSFRVSRDDRFDIVELNSDGTTSTKPGDVLLISLGDSHISHVGSSACLAQDGIVKVGDAANFDFESVERGTPFLNDFIEKNRNLWQGKAKTIAIRSQDGLPIALYAGDNVEIFATDIPKSTWFRIDGKYLLCYRVDYSMPDTDLLN